MADIHRKQLELIFKTFDEKQVTLAILDPKDDLTATKSNAVAQTILTKNIFAFSGGDLKEFVKAQIRVLDVTVLA